MILGKERLLELIEDKDLISNYPYLETQINPNGFDLTVSEIRQFNGPGKLDFSNSERVIPATEKIEPEKKKETDDYGWWSLAPASYKVVTNEKIKLPLDLAAIAFPRSSLLRSGAFVQHGVWDAGFEGKSEFILVVNNPEGLEIKQNARITQIMFVRTTGSDQGYEGVYNNL